MTTRHRVARPGAAAVLAFLSAIVCTTPAHAQGSVVDPAAAATDSAAIAASPQAGPLGSVVVPPFVAVTGSADLLPVASLAQSAGTLPSPLVSSVGRLAGGTLGYGTDVEQLPDATVPEVLSRTPIEDARAHGPAELWRVASPAMKRVVPVEVYLPERGGPAPVVYLLDGVYSAEPSDFLLKDAGIAAARAQGFAVAVPTGANGSEYADWQADDPVLGRNKWQTFLTEELPPLVEGDQRIGFNGNRAIAGISMGAGGALRIAAARPELYRAAAGVSGCYGTLSDADFDSLRITVESRGGTFANMWGERGSQTFRDNDLFTHVDRLRDMHVFISSANGTIGPVEAATYGAQPEVLFVGHTLETQTSGCTARFADALRSDGQQPTVRQTDTGIHNWATFSPSLDAAFADLAPHLR